MFCPNCGQQVENGARFCGNCGAQMNSGKSAPVQGVNPFAENGASMPVFGDDSSNEITEIPSGVKYGGAAAMGVAALFVLLNIGGVYNGFKLIVIFFRSLDSLSRYMSGDDVIVIVFALACHLLVPIFGVIALIGFLRDNKPKLSCIFALVASVMGLISCLIAGWNATAEVFGLIGCIVGLVMCGKIDIEETI